ncbi:hypothetical protein HZH68_014969 [Vespula germanica]|uniref:Uncharacterized protein n=1 Tax=Vespula germanica TaxID=30212 RepID=A0A834MSP6_VESGE|nr:hypothetical protein HZH68_014969 [Vespula germanica]
MAPEYSPSSSTFTTSESPIIVQLVCCLATVSWMCWKFLQVGDYPFGCFTIHWIAIFVLFLCDVFTCTIIGDLDVVNVELDEEYSGAIYCRAEMKNILEILVE